jgi:hypothetical protein
MSSPRPHVPGLAIAVLLVLLAGGALAVTAGASKPDEGTVSVDSPMTSWEGEFFATGHTKTGNLCAVPSDDVCDSFDLTVDVPASHWESNTGGVEVKIAWEDENDDFDLYVYDDDGTLVGESANGGTSSERVFIEDASGTYRVAVAPWKVSDSAYDGGAHVESRADVGQTGGEVPAEPLSGVPCDDGRAGPFPCSGVDLESFLPRDAIGGGELNDIWGWTDPQTRREYALIGKTSGTSFVDVTDARNPVYLGDLPSHQPVETIFSTWRDVKVTRTTPTSSPRSRRTACRCST